MSQPTENNSFPKEIAHIITSESSESNPRNKSVATVENEEISLQEQKQLAGLEKTFDQESSTNLISREYQYSQQSEPERRDVADSAVPRTVLVLTVVGAVVMAVLFMFLGFGGSGKKEVEKQVEPEVKAQVPEESDIYKARLAVADQKQDQRLVDGPASTRGAQLEQASKKEPVKRETRASRRQSPTRIEQSEQPEPRRVRTLRSQTEPSRPARTLAPESVVDPQQRWNLLAAAGTQQLGAEAAAVENSQDGLGTSSDETQGNNPVSDRQASDTSLPETQNDTSIGERQASDTSLAEVQVNTPTSDRQVLPTGRISQVVIGDRAPVVSNSRTISNGSEGIVMARAGQPLISQTDGNISGNIANSGSASVTAGVQGIISRQQSTGTNQSVTQTSFQVPIGSSASARVSVPIIWSEDGSSPTAGRFAVTLTEPLIAQNGEIALPKDTVLVTEVTEITPDNHVVYQSAVAIVYRDRAGRIQQQEIAPNNLIIRGDRNQPLIAKGSRQSNGGVLKQDLLVGALSSLGKIGEIINRPEEEIVREDDGFDSYRRERRTSSGERDVLAAALSGFFDASANRIGKRSERSVQQQLARKPVLVVPEGEKATVYVNSFLEVKR